MNRLCPSMMCVRPSDTAGMCRVFEENGITALHVDIMDGSFVPNFTLGTDYCWYLHEISTLPLDIHMMVDRPEDKLDWFPIKDGDYVSIHTESTNHLGRAVERVRAKGGIPLAAINPATPVSVLNDILPTLGGVLIMTVNPGFAGQKLCEYTLGKISALREMTDLPIEVDGNVSAENLVKMKRAGADMFVVGTSGFLNTSDTDEVADGIRKFRKI